jgi:hypothetical protein
LFAEPSLVAESISAEPLFVEPLSAEPSLVAEPSFRPQCCPNSTTNGSLEPIVAEPLFAEPLLVAEHLFADGPLELIVAVPSFAKPSHAAEPIFAEPLLAEPLFAEPSLVAEPSPRPQCCPNATTNGSLEPIVAEPLFAEPSLVAEPLFADGSLELIVAEPSFAEHSLVAEPMFAELLFAEPLFAEPSQVAEHSPRPQCCPNATFHAPGREPQAQPNPHSGEEHIWPRLIQKGKKATQAQPESQTAKKDLRPWPNDPNFIYSSTCTAPFFNKVPQSPSAPWGLAAQQTSEQERKHSRTSTTLLQPYPPQVEGPSVSIKAARTPWNAGTEPELIVAEHPFAEPVFG